MIKRQGDVLIIRVNEIPHNARKRKSRILVEGEATGHMHELDSGEVYEKEGVLYFKVSDDQNVILNHQEHNALSFNTGSYKVIMQREYEPSGWRQVSD